MILIKEVLIFLLFFQYSKAEKINDFKDSCLEAKGKLLDRWERICIPREYLGILLLSPETTNTNVKVSKLQIINIGHDSITLSMVLEMNWIENRLKINMQGVPRQLISLSKEDQNHIWKPKIGIKSNVVSESREGNVLGLFVDEVWCEIDEKICKEMKFGSWLVAYQKFSLSTTVKCEMDYQKFPFDKHVCNIEVN